MLMLVFCCAALWAGETNKLYITVTPDGRDVPIDETNLNESLPAVEFPKGNWGAVEGNIQLSLRFDKESYTNGEPIVATVILRNVADHKVRYSAIRDYSMDGPARFIVTTGDQQRISSLDSDGTVSSGNIPASRQRKFLVRFDKEYRLTNGTYTVQSFVAPEDIPGQIKSGAVKIKVVGTPK